MIWLTFDEVLFSLPQDTQWKKETHFYVDLENRIGYTVVHDTKKKSCNFFKMNKILGNANVSGAQMCLAFSL